ncbi:uncharacterized protein ARMOST_18643 [Armillaria ostoyae]|uniref:Uncharacterized protein n=1 Tax=Armillaria ostoyae TaxID=47428 RepID=A0A284S2B0_ARMOS|nr:uncharacterized protein ARMOST_18643 [Armillaria ostoyae]
MGKKAKATICPTLVILKSLQAAGELAPFPYIKGIAALTITILEMIDDVSMNDKDIQELAEHIGHTITIVKDVALTYSQTDNGDASIIEDVCADFMWCLKDICHNLESMQSNNASKRRIMQYLTTANVHDEINGFMRQVDNLQRNFDTNNILTIHANNEIVDRYLRAFEHDIRELRMQNSDVQHVTTLVLVMQTELQAQVSEQHRLLEAMITKREGGEGTIVVQNNIKAHYRFLATLTATFFWAVSCFTNLLPALSSRGPKIILRLSPRMTPTLDNASMSAPHKKVVCIGINYVSHKGYPQVHGQLSGSIKDAVKISSFLSEYWRSSFQGTIEIKILRDDSSNADEIPMKNNIIKAIRWLITSRGFIGLSFGQIRDRNGDEADGYEEVILPVDGDCIYANDMHELMAKPLPLGCRLVVRFLQAVTTQCIPN